MPYLAKQQVSWPLLPPSGQSNTRPTYNLHSRLGHFGGLKENKYHDHSCHHQARAVPGPPIVFTSSPHRQPKGLPDKNPIRCRILI